MRELALLAPAVSWAPSVPGLRDAPAAWLTGPELLELAHQQDICEADMARLKRWLAALSSPVLARMLQG